VLYYKFVMGLPLHRQEQQFSHLGIPFSRQTMSNWLISVSERWLSILYGRFHSILVTQSHLHADETPMQVLKEPGRSYSSKSYMWLFRTGRQDHPIVLYDYQPSRAKYNPRNFLAGFTGYLQADGYSAYEGLPGVTLVGCWAHARRGFVDALKALPKSATPATETLAEQGRILCDRLFQLEASLKEVSPAERHAARLTDAKPLLEEIWVWLKSSSKAALPKCATGKAIAYCLNQWTKLTAFLEDGRLEIDNNRAERSVRPVVVGRKNWLFANTPAGATASATIYSIVETAKENGLNPMAYLAYILEQLPNIETGSIHALDTLLPWSDSLPDLCRMPVDPRFASITN